MNFTHSMGTKKMTTDLQFVYGQFERRLALFFYVVLFHRTIFVAIFLYSLMIEKKLQGQIQLSKSDRVEIDEILNIDHWSIERWYSLVFSQIFFSRFHIDYSINRWRKLLMLLEKSRFIDRMPLIFVNDNYDLSLHKVHLLTFCLLHALPSAMYLKKRIV